MPTSPARPVLPAQLTRQRVGVLIPLFSVRTDADMGVGEILDLIPFIDWMAAQGFSVLQLLPLNECSPSETSPYQSLSSFAIDPVYLSLDGGLALENRRAFEEGLEASDIQAQVRRLRDSPRVCYEEIRVLKNDLFQAAFEKFKQEEWDRGSDRAAAFKVYIEQKSVWLEDYVLFRLLKEKYHWSHWRSWPEAFQKREPEALSLLREADADRILFFQFLQWTAWEQWHRVRRHAAALDVLLMGDMPFLISDDSADVWSDQASFRADISVGAPPDDFSATGQDWGLPFFDWDVMKGNDFKWWRSRIAEASQTFDILRLDHVVGFFRVWIIEKDQPPRFEPGPEAEQLARGNTLLNIVIEEAGATIPIAEDLGVIPDFVRQRLSALSIAGMKVLRWEKDGTHYRDPNAYPFVSLATTGTHDTTPLVIWWETASWEDKRGFLEMLGAADALSPDSPFDERLHEKILDRLLGSGAGLVTLPIQDLFAQRDRINTPATVGADNWRYRLPLSLSALETTSPYKEKLVVLKTLIARHHRVR